jgi:Cytochrome c554 and c-prime
MRVFGSFDCSRLSAAVLLALLATGTALAAGRYEGVASCAGSTCHGRAEGNGAVVRQDELRLWQEPSARSGAHSRAYAALVSPRGERIAGTLGLGSAGSAAECLGCHATPPGERGERFLVSDGVGCEGCHGPASGWIASHYAVGASHQANVAGGMIPLDEPAARAGVCLDCHLGSARPGQFVTHAMMAAGHPRLSFELDLFSSLQQHWDDDADYRSRKPQTDSVRLWAVGQAEAVRRSLNLFSQGSLANNGIFPEFTFYDCHSCHRAIDDNPARQRTFEPNQQRPIEFGQPPFNDENIIMLSAVAQVLAPTEAARFDKAAREFHAAMGRGRSEAVAAGARLDAAAAALGTAMAQGPGGSDTAFRVVAAIGGRAISPRFTDYAGSAQAVMAVDTLLNALVREGRVTVGAAAGIRASISRAYAAVASPTDYSPGQFRAALGQAVRSIEVLR